MNESRVKLAKFPGTVVVGVIIAFLASTQANAAFPIFEIMAKYSEFLVGEDVRVRMSVSNPSGGDVFSFVKLGGGMYPGSFEIRITDPMGNPIQSSPSFARQHPFVAEVDKIKLAGGARWEGEQSASQTTQVPGKHIVRVTYRPNWKGPPEIVREFSIHVVAVESAIVGTRSSFQSDDGSKIEITKVHTADGYWLCSISHPDGVIQRLAQINEQCTFKVSERQDFKDYPGGIRVLTYQLDGTEHIIRLANRSGSVIPDNWPAQ